MLEINAPHGVLGDCTAFPQRFHSVAGVSTARTLAFCNFLNATETLYGRHLGVTGV